MKKYLTDVNFFKAFLFASVFLVGGYHLAASCVLTVILLLFVIFKALSQKDFFSIKPNVVLIVMSLVAVSYLAVTIWAVDKGTAIYGFFKLLPVGVFTFVLSAYDKDTRNQLLEAVPFAAASSGVLAYVLSFIPAFSNYFLVAERLGGFFQSPNIFASLCLVGIIILLTAERVSAKNLILTAVLMILVFLTGSRTVFVFLLLTIVVLLFKIKNKRVKLSLLGIAAGVIAVSVIVVLITGNVQTVGRFLTISLESSTLLGRLLYYLDALPVILKHPFGLGYYGYYFTQGSFQTGVYSVVFVHNSVLQYFLDIGFIPAIAFVVLVAGSFFSKSTSFRQRLVLFVLFGHSLLDFDFEFTAMLLILVLVLDFDLFKKPDAEFKCNSYVLSAASVVLVLFSVYFGMVNALYLFGEHKAVDKIYGHDTMSKMYLISEEKSGTALLKYADEIIEENGNLAIAYDVKANAAYKEGDFKRVSEYKKKAIGCALYSKEEYVDYCQKLAIGVSLYMNVGDTKSAEYCQKEMVWVSEKLQEVKDNTSELGWKIYDKPQLNLPAEYVRIIEEYKESEK